MELEKGSTNSISSWVLGSSSKWRREIFREHFQSDLFAVADIDEKAIRHPKAEIMTQMIAKAKAEEIVWNNQDESTADCEDKKCDLRDNILICCDQVIRFNGEIREKPESREQCRAYLTSYQQQPDEFVECINGVCAYFNRQFLTHYEISKLTFKNLTNEKIDDLVKLDDLMTCAGGFTICHMELNDLKGTVNGVEGLPIETVRQLGNVCVNLHLHGHVTHIIFNTSVLLNTEAIYKNAHKLLCKKYDVELDRENNSLVSVLSDYEAAENIIQTFDLKEITTETYLEELHSKVEQMLTSLEFLTGSEQLIIKARTLGIPLILVCRSSRMLNALKTTDIGKQLLAMFSDICIHNVIDSTTGKNSIYQQAFQKLSESQAPPKCEAILVFEDTPLGAQEACSAGMRVIMCPGVDNAGCLPDVVGNGCLLEVETLQDFDVAQFIK